MSANNSFSSFTLYDLISNIVPGAIVLLTGTILLLPFTQPGLASGGPILTAFVILSFLFGRGIQAVASHFDTPQMFGKVVDAIEDDSLESPFTLTQIEEEFWENCESELSLTKNFNHNGRLMKAILSYLETRPAVRALRFQAIWTFCRNMCVVSWITIGLSFITAIIYAIRPELGGSVWLSFLLLIAGFAELAIFDGRKKKFNKTFIKYIFIDFYVESNRK